MEALIDLIRKGSRRIKPLPVEITARGMLPRRPRAVLFDVYGTLLTRAETARPLLEKLIKRRSLGHDASWLTAAVREAIAEEHSALRARGVAHPEVRIETVWGRLFPRRGREELRAMIVEYELAVHPAWPMPGCRRLLAALRRDGVTLGIISNAQFYTPLFLEAFLGAGIEALGFTPSLCLYSCDFQVAKPHPSLFGLARERMLALGASPEETLMIGNSLVEDMVPAARAGFMTVMAALDRRTFDLPRGIPPEEKPDAVITRLSCVETLLEACIQRRGL